MKRLFKTFVRLSIALPLLCIGSCSSEDDALDDLQESSGEVREVSWNNTSINLLSKDYSYEYKNEGGRWDTKKENLQIRLCPSSGNGTFYLTRNNYYEQPRAILTLDTVGVVSSMDDIDLSKIKRVDSLGNASSSSVSNSVPLRVGLGYIAKYEATHKVHYSSIVGDAEDNKYRHVIFYIRFFIRKDDSSSPNGYKIQYQAPWNP